MTQEEKKDLLLKDLSARLPYGVKGIIPYNGDKDIFTVKGIFNILFLSDTESCLIEDFQPYLFPLSSMTDEQENEYNNLNGYELGCFPHTEEALDYLIKNHFDYRGLIPMGLANDATGLNIY